MDLHNNRSLLRPMLSAPRKQVTLFSLLAITTISASIFAIVLAKHQQVLVQRAIDRATFYSHVVQEQANVTGHPLAKVVAIDNGEPVAGTIIGMTLIGPDGGDGGPISSTSRSQISVCPHGMAPRPTQLRRSATTP